MNHFSGYLTSIFITGICAFICESLCSFFGSSKALTKALNIISSLILFTVIVFPLIDSVMKIRIDKEEYLPQTGKTETTGYEHLTSLTAEQLGKNLTVKMFEETGIYAESISIDFNDSTEAPMVEGVRVSVNSTLDDDKAIISEYLKGVFGNKINVEITEL